jgi:hypothetical protein
MKNYGAAFLALLLLLECFAAPKAYALDGEALKKFCAAPDRKLPLPGKQLNGMPADMQVLELKAGTYNLQGSDGAIQVFGNNSFILTKPRSLVAFMGGDDLMVDANDVGGCSREQLSEILKTNNLTLPSLPPTDFLDKPAFASGGLMGPPVNTQPAGLPSSVLKVMP